MQTLGASARLAINSGYPVRFVKTFTQPVKVRVLVMDLTHVRFVEAAGDDEASVQDFPMVGQFDECFNLAPEQDISFLLDDDGSAPTKEAGSIVFSSVADVDDTVTISDGVNTVVFTFKAAGDGATGAAVQVAHGASAAASATNLFNAINNNALLQVTATNGTPGTVDVVNDLYVDGEITKSDGDNDYAVTDFSGGAVAESFVWVTEVR